MKLPTTYIWTHDSIGLGEDGPTHQPIEQLASLRAVPGPLDRPPGRRQRDLGGAPRDPRQPDRPGRPRPHPAEPADPRGHRRRRRRARRLRPAGRRAAASPQLVLIATGSEVQLAVEARKVFEDEGVPTRVVSMPCVEWFDAQDRSYTPQRPPAGGQGPRLRRGRASRRPGTASSATTASASRSSTSAPAPTTRPCSSSSGSPPRPSSRPAGARSPARNESSA